MTGQVLLRELIHRSAAQAVRDGKSADDCPAEFAEHSAEWVAEYYEIAIFEGVTCKNQ